MPPLQWAQYSEAAHLVVFEERRPWEMDRIDYALVAIDGEKRDGLGYVTARELDKESVYWQFGGAFPTIKNTIYVLKVYDKIIKWTKKQGYSRVTTYIENTNRAYMRLALTCGFRVIGTRTFKGTVLCEMLLEFDDDTKGVKTDG